MPFKQERFRIAVLDDYQHVALSLADWSVLDARATVTVFNDHLADSDAGVERLQPFDIVCVMRERTPMTRTIIERLPKLRLDREPECLDRPQGCRTRSRTSAVGSTPRQRADASCRRPHEGEHQDQMTIVIDIVPNCRSGAPRLALYPTRINPGSPRGGALAAKSAT
jgi:hypothetical protein